MSLNTYDSSSGTLTTIASANRIWTGTKDEWNALVQAGTAPRNVLVALTDDEDDFPVGNTDISEIGDGTITGAIAYLFQNGGGGMPALDYANPLHTFTSSNKTYTAIADCYVLGEIPELGAQTVNFTINNTSIVNTTVLGSTKSMFISPLKLSAGDIATYTGSNTEAYTRCSLKVYGLL